MTCKINLVRQKNTKMGRINQKGTRMVREREDLHGLQTTKLKNLDYIFQDAPTMT